MSLTVINQNEFRECSGLVKYLIPEGVTTIRQMSMYQANNVSIVVIPSTTTALIGTAVIGKHATKQNIPYDVLIKANSVPSANGNINYYANDLRYIYVPDNLLDQYKTAEYWSSVSSRYKGYSELPAEYKQYWP